MMRIWFIGIFSIFILGIAAIGTGSITPTGFFTYLQKNGDLNLIILIFGTAIIITGFGFFLRGFKR